MFSQRVTQLRSKPATISYSILRLSDLLHNLEPSNVMNSDLQKVIETFKVGFENHEQEMIYFASELKRFLALHDIQLSNHQRRLLKGLVDLMYQS
jgi:hypothetical protein